MKRVRVLAGILLLLLISFVFVFFLKKESRLSSCKNCNVILISLDTLAATHMPCYGYDKNTMPNLCAFGKENVLFDNSYSQSFWTLPSHMSIFTSLYPTTHKVLRGLIDSLNPKYKTIAEMLKENSYNTLYFGPLNDISMPLDKGIGSGFDYVEKEYGLESWDKGLQMLLENQKNNKKTFLFLHTYQMHYPYFPRKAGPYQFIDMSKRNPEIPMTKEEYKKADQDFINYVTEDVKKRIESATTKDSLEIDKSTLNVLESDKSISEKIDYFNKNDSTFLYEQWQGKKIKSKSDLEFYTSIYDETASELDDFLKGFLAEIKKNNIDKNTIIIITSDHGEGFDEHGFVTHCGTNPNCLYNEIIKVPLIMSIPGVKNREIKNVVQGIDIYPTILSFLNIKLPNYIEGLSLKSMIKNSFFQKKHQYIISEHTVNQKAVVNENWKLYIVDNRLLGPESIKLFDLTSDKNEQKDLSKTDVQKVKEMEKIYLDFYNRPGARQADTPQKNLPNWIDETRKKRLIDGGYF